MSHTMNIAIDMRDRAALKAACDRLAIHYSEGQHRLYNTTRTGFGVYLPGWNFPVVVNDDGTVDLDNYGGRWGKMEALHKLQAYYGAAKATAEARKLGHEVYEYQDQNGDLRLRVVIGG